MSRIRPSNTFGSAEPRFPLGGSRKTGVATLETSQLADQVIRARCESRYRLPHQELRCTSRPSHPGEHAGVDAPKRGWFSRRPRLVTWSDCESVVVPCETEMTGGSRPRIKCLANMYLHPLSAEGRKMHVWSDQNAGPSLPELIIWFDGDDAS